ncbi:MAG: hypothetical protein QOD26_3976 [Betaproteobacteria bacterium]|jgi:hypothetical protein|nr:hypothetical protein [Betaproteobacteria bacterium]
MIPIPSRRKKLAGEPDFERPPLWIHEAVAGVLAPGAERKYLSSKREAKRRELLEMLDRIPIPAKPAKRSAKTAPAGAEVAAAKPPSGRPSATRR